MAADVDGAHAPSRPPLALAVAVSLVLVAAMAYLSLGVYRTDVVPLTYVLPLLVCVWHRYRSLLWGMAAAFAAIVAIKFFRLLPDEAVDGRRFSPFAMQIVNIGIAGAIIHAIIQLRDRVESRTLALMQSNADLTRMNSDQEAANEELAAREEEVTRQNEELRSQTEELERQGEELRAQAEELEAESEKRGRREKVLDILLGWSHSNVDEQAVMEGICRAAGELLSGDAAAIVEKKGEALVYRASSAEAIDLVRASWPMERSFAALVMERRKTAYLDDIARRPDLEIPQPAAGPAFRSILATPLLIHGTPVGAIEVYGRQPREWSESHFHLIEWMAAKCSLVLQTLRLREQEEAAEESLRVHNQRLGLLSDAAAHLLSTDAEAMVKGLFEKVKRHLGLDAYFNFMVNEAGDALRLDSCSGISYQDSREIERLEFGEAVCGTVAQRREAIIVTDVQRSDDPKVRLIRSYGFRVYACNPLMAGDRLLGTLSFASKSRDSFTEDELDLLRTISHYVAIAKERLREDKALADALEREKAARAEQEKANQAKDNFLAALSHELRTPLSPVLMLATILENDPDLPEGLREDLQTMRRNVELEARLIDDLLDVTRIARGKMRLVRRSVDGCEVLHHAVETCQADAVEKGVELVLEEEAEERTLMADPARLQQAFWNVIKNAIKFTSKGGRVRARCFNREGKAAPGQRMFVVEVEDSGIGIDPEVLPRLFKVFEQGGDQATRRAGGLGLGLSIAKGVLELHSGEIGARSEGLGKGATFTMEVPLAESAAVRKEPIGPPRLGRLSAPAGKPLSILLVEDHESTASVLARLLARFGFQVKTAGTVASAISEYQRERFDVVISDLGLPDGNGHELLQRLLDIRPVPAIALTGYGMESDIEKSKEAGFLEHLTKPVGVEQLEAAIGRITGLGQPARGA